MSPSAEGSLVCSPSGEANYKKYKSCFSPEAIGELVRMWNAKHPSAQIPIGGNAQMLRELRKRMRKELAAANKSVSQGVETDLAAVEHLNASHTPSVAQSLRPSKPREWKSKPHEWLDNFNIDAVMSQYNLMKEFEYKFLGVFPVDFAEPMGPSGECYTPQMCALNLRDDLLAKGFKYTGFVINLDRHDEPGSHWTSIFAVLDPALPSYGAYYYDSIGRRWPPEIERYLSTWKRQMDALHPKQKFRLDWSRVSHQRANTECGMFSMLFQILWIERLKFDTKRTKQEERAAKKLIKSGKLPEGAKRILEDKSPASFEMITSMPIKDVNAFYLRDTLFRGAGLRPRASPRTSREGGKGNARKSRASN